MVSTTYNCLIVDDEPIAHRILETYLADNDRLGLRHHAYDTIEARDWCAGNRVDVLLLDIQMPGETGLEFLRSLERRPVTIFTTAHLEYALEGYELGVLDYLVKPVRKERFDTAMQRAVEFLDLQALRSELRPVEPEQGLIRIQSGTKTVEIPVVHISHIQGLKDYAIIYAGGQRHVVRTTMKKLETLLQPYDLVRVHKSFIVPRSRLKAYRRNRLEFDGYQIPVGRKYRMSVDFNE